MFKCKYCGTNVDSHETPKTCPACGYGADFDKIEAINTQEYPNESATIPETDEAGPENDTAE